MEENELIINVWIEDDSAVMIMGDRGSIQLAREKSWISTKYFSLDVIDPEIIKSASVFYDSRNVYALYDEDEHLFFLLKQFPNLLEETDQTLKAIREKIKEGPIMRESNIAQEMIEFLENAIVSIGDVNSDDTESQQQSEFEKLMGEFTLERFSIMIVIFYLVHVFIRIYQYNIRLSQFWTSRSDALLLAESFTNRNTDSFDELVGLLASDAHEFKSLPGPTHRSLSSSRQQPGRRPTEESQ